ncbi:helix-turn-helix domain-containing protein [Brachybacterium sp. AOP24-D1-21]|uniref:helix-turn-helix domain-containing protein n=1 Tax=Brachybacterium sp. AOP24-D1-21 TaxID=3457711 RepID=UPI004034B344
MFGSELGIVGVDQRNALFIGSQGWLTEKGTPTRAAWFARCIGFMRQLGVVACPLLSLCLLRLGPRFREQCPAAWCVQDAGEGVRAVLWDLLWVGHRHALLRGLMRARGESCANTRAATGSDNFLEVITTRHEAGCVTEPLKKVLGAQVRDLRLVRHLSQEGLAEELGVSTRYLAGIERGERNLTLDSVDALAEQLGVEAHALIVRR